MIIGLTRGTGKAHIARAAMESIAFQVADLLDPMGADAGIELKELRVDGGATANESHLQFQADMLGIPVVRCATSETTALGTAYLAGLAVGYWQIISELKSHWIADKTFYPKMERFDVSAMRQRWNEAVNRSLNWAD